MPKPSTYTDEVAHDICERIATGESLAEICRTPGAPAMRTVMGWLRRHDTFAQDYARAREAQADADADAIADIARRALAGEIEPNAARVAIDAMKWTAGKRQPKKYGDRLELAGDAKSPLTVQVVRLADDPGKGG